MAKRVFRPNFHNACCENACLYKQKTVEGFASLQKAMHIVAKRSGDMVKYTGKEKIP